MEGFWASSKEEKERIIEKVLSDFSYESKQISFEKGINIPELIAGILVDNVSIELSNENPMVTISYGRSREATGLVVWSSIGDLRDIACVPWGKEIFAAAGPVFTALTSLTSPINVPTPYTYMTYEELLEHFKNLKSENEYLRKQLSATYTPEKLQRNSILFGVLSLGTLILNSFFDINILNPIAGYLIFGISFVFYLMSILMKREEKK
jgi:hypothetical protein